MADDHFLKSVELRLLCCTLSNTFPNRKRPRQQSPPSLTIATKFSNSSCIEDGRYASVLSSVHVFPFAQSYVYEDTVDSAARFYDRLGRSAADFPKARRRDNVENDSVDVEGRVVMLLCLAVAAVLALSQENFTGPVGSFLPFPLMFLGAKEFGNGGSGGQWDLWAWNKVTLVGSELQGKFSLLQYIVYADIVLKKIVAFAMEGDRTCIHGCKSTLWWLCRVLLLNKKF